MGEKRERPSETKFRERFAFHFNFWSGDGGPTGTSSGHVLATRIRPSQRRRLFRRADERRLLTAARGRCRALLREPRHALLALLAVSQRELTSITCTAAFIPRITSSRETSTKQEPPALPDLGEGGPHHLLALGVVGGEQAHLLQCSRRSSSARSPISFRARSCSTTMTAMWAEPRPLALFSGCPLRQGRCLPRCGACPYPIQL